MRPKTINIFLMDGDPNGRVKCTLTNWTGLAYKISFSVVLPKAQGNAIFLR